MSTVGHTARGITKQTKTSKQANKTTKNPKGQGVASIVLAQAKGTIPVSPKEKDREKAVISVDYPPKCLYRELFIHFNLNIPAIIPLLNKYQVLGLLLKCKGSRQDRAQGIW